MKSSYSKLKRCDIVVSSQAIAGSPLVDPEALTRIGLDAIAGGASALRLAGADTVAFASTRVDVPIIGLIKTNRVGYEPRITATSEEIQQLMEAGAQIIAIDATHRKRPEPLERLFQIAVSNSLEVFADIATLEEAQRSMDLGATYIATTMSGYTDARAITEGPDFELLEGVIALGAKAVLEGRVSTSAHIQQALDLGAHSVVIGRAITSPQSILRGILEGVKR
jgi:N-acylglucosamine-6-phosphate 2-epimerase